MNIKQVMVVLLIFQMLLSVICLGQKTDWLKTYGMATNHANVVKDIQPSKLTDASYICGYHYEMGLNSGVPFTTGPGLGYFAKLNAKGDTIWARNMSSNISGVGRVFTPSAMAVDKYDNMYVIGTYNTYGSGETYYLDTNTFSSYGGAYLLKFDSSGNLLKKIDTHISYVEYNDIDIDIYGNIYILGNVQSSITYGSTKLKPSGYNLYLDFIVSYDAGMNLRWAQPYGEIDLNNTQKFFRYGALQSLVVDKTPAAHLYACGLFLTPYTFQNHTLTSNGSEDAMIIKLDNKGNYIDEMQLGSTYGDEFWSISINKSGRLAIGGLFAVSTVINGTTYTTGSSSPLYNMCYYLSLDTAFNFRFVKTGGLSGQVAVSIDELGNCALIKTNGYSSGSNLIYNFLTLYDSAGNIIFNKSAVLPTGSSSNTAMFPIATSFSIINPGYLHCAGNYRPSMTVDSLYKLTTAVSYCTEVMVHTVQYPADTCKFIFDLGKDTSYCGSFSRVLKTGVPYARYKWSLNNILIDSSEKITAVTAGRYKVSVSKKNCSAITADSILLKRLNPPLPINLGNDTLVCNADSLMLHAPDHNDKRQWDNNSKDTAYWFKVKTNGKHWLKTFNVCGTRRDTIIISFLHSPPKPNLGKDSTICNQSQFVLDAGPNKGNKIMWNNQMKDSGQTFTAYSKNTYSVKITNACGFSGDTINLDFRSTPTVELGRDTTVCNKTSFVIDAGNSKGNTIKWNNVPADSGLQYTATLSGKYFVAVANQCGTGRDTISITFQKHPTVYLGRDTGICPNTGLTLDAGNTGTAYEWMGNSSLNTRNFSVNKSGRYSVKVSNACGVAADTINISQLTIPVVNLGKDSTVRLPFSKTLDAGNPGCRYRWSTSASDTLRTLTVKNPGIYWVEVSNACGKSRDSIYFKAQSGIETITGMDQYIHVYPNPSNGVFYLDANLPESLSDEGFNLSVTDLQGRVICSSVITGGVITIDLKEQAGGIYFLSIGNGKTYFHCRLVKQ